MFHDLTNLPCMTCGMTRCAIQFFRGRFLAALQWNPFVFVVLCGVIAFDLYALATVSSAYATTADPSFHAACENIFACLSYLRARAKLDLFAAALAQLLECSAWVPLAVENVASRRLALRSICG